MQRPLYLLPQPHRGGGVVGRVQLWIICGGGWGGGCWHTSVACCLTAHKTVGTLVRSPLSGLMQGLTQRHMLSDGLASCYYYFIIYKIVIARFSIWSNQSLGLNIFTRKQKYKLGLLRGLVSKLLYHNSKKQSSKWKKWIITLSVWFQAAGDKKVTACFCLHKWFDSKPQNTKAIAEQEIAATLVSVHCRLELNVTGKILILTHCSNCNGRTDESLFLHLEIKFCWGPQMTLALLTVSTVDVSMLTRQCLS